MRLRRNISKFQEGGAMPMEDPAMAEGQTMTEGPAPQGGGDPIEELIMAAMQAVETQDCEVALGVCQVLAELAMQQGGGDAPQEPQFAKQGAKLVRRR